MATRKRDGEIKLRASHHGASSSPPRAKPARPGARKPKPVRKLPGAPRESPSREDKRDAPAHAPGASVRKVRMPNVPRESVASDDARRLAIDIAAAALEKKAVGLEILDVAGRTDYADFLVLMSGRSDRQVAALADGIEEALRLKGRRAVSVEGRQGARWILIDFGDVVVHVFQEDARSMYDLEGLFEDARRVPVSL